MEPVNRLMQGAKRALVSGAGRAHQKLEQFFDEVPAEELQARIKLRDQVLREATSEDFKAFHADAVVSIKADTRELLSMSLKEFAGNSGVELRGKILGAESVFQRIASIIEQGNKAESILESRQGRRVKPEAHTNFSS